MALSSNPEKRAKQLANLKRFENGHVPLPGAGRPRDLEKILRKLLATTAKDDPQHRAYREILMDAMLKRAIVRSDTLLLEILNRIDGKQAEQIGHTFDESLSAILNAADERVRRERDRAKESKA